MDGEEVRFSQAQGSFREVGSCRSSVVMLSEHGFRGVGVLMEKNELSRLRTVLSDGDVHTPGHRCTPDCVHGPQLGNVWYLSRF